MTGLLDSNKKIAVPFRSTGTVTSGAFLSSETVNIPNPNQFMTVLLDISVSPYANGEEWDCSLNGAFTGASGSIVNSIKRNGRYFMKLSGQNVSLWFGNGDGETSKTVTINYIFMDEPIINDVKPITKILSKKVTIPYTTTTDVTPIFRQRIEGYKFYFVVLQITTEGGASKQVSLNLKGGFEDTFAELDANNHTMGMDVIGEFSGSYVYHTDWKQVLGPLIDIALNIPDTSTNTVVYMNLYGVR